MSFYAVQLITLKNNKIPSRRPLGLLMFLMLVYVVINISRYLGYSNVYRYLYIIQLPVLLSIIPSYCLYFRILTKIADKVLIKPLIFCFLPALFVMVLNIVSLLGMTTMERGLFFSGVISSLSAHNMAINLASVIFLIGNTLLVVMQIVVVPFKLRHVFLKFKERQNNDALLDNYFEAGWSLLIFIAVIGFVLINTLLNFFVTEYNTTLAALFNIGILFTGGLAGYFALKQDKIFLKIAEVNGRVQLKNMGKESGSKKEYSITPEESKEILLRLKKFFASEKPYLDKKLRVIDIARKIGISKHKLTYVINHDLGSNFYGFINKYRVSEAKRLIMEPDNRKYNMDIIGEMAGFQSKSSFNGCFKKLTGMTPSAYRRNCKTNRFE
jgi:AraC-like DNA-binding protein